jgi:PHD/YefM family antitoxin component YafN of YafNO toxin-antitoxin module
MKPLKELAVVTRNGKPTAVILPLRDYKVLRERAEDAEDVRWLRNRRNKPMVFRPLQEFLAERDPGRGKPI